MAMEQLDKARVGIAAQALGIAQAALEVAVAYAAQRKAFGKSINQQQAVKVIFFSEALSFFISFFEILDKACRYGCAIGGCTSFSVESSCVVR